MIYGRWTQRPRLVWRPCWKQQVHFHYIYTTVCVDVFRLLSKLKSMVFRVWQFALV